MLAVEWAAGKGVVGCQFSLKGISQISHYGGVLNIIIQFAKTLENTRKLIIFDFDIIPRYFWNVLKFLNKLERVEIDCEAVELHNLLQLFTISRGNIALKLGVFLAYIPYQSLIIKEGPPQVNGKTKGLTAEDEGQLLKYLHEDLHIIVAELECTMLQHALPFIQYLSKLTLHEALDDDMDNGKFVAHHQEAFLKSNLTEIDLNSGVIWSSQDFVFLLGLPHLERFFSEDICYDKNTKKLEIYKEYQEFPEEIREILTLSKIAVVSVVMNFAVAEIIDYVAAYCSATLTSIHVAPDEYDDVALDFHPIIGKFPQLKELHVISCSETYCTVLPYNLAMKHSAWFVKLETLEIDQLENDDALPLVVCIRLTFLHFSLKDVSKLQSALQIVLTLPKLKLLMIRRIVRYSFPLQEMHIMNSRNASVMTAITRVFSPNSIVKLTKGGVLPDKEGVRVYKEAMLDLLKAQKDSLTDLKCSYDSKYQGVELIAALEKHCPRINKLFMLNCSTLPVQLKLKLNFATLSKSHLQHVFQYDTEHGVLGIYSHLGADLVFAAGGDMAAEKVKRLHVMIEKRNSELHKTSFDFEAALAEGLERLLKRGVELEELVLQLPRDVDLNEMVDFFNNYFTESLHTLRILGAQRLHYTIIEYLIGCPFDPRIVELPVRDSKPMDELKLRLFVNRKYALRELTLYVSPKCTWTEETFRRCKLKVKIVGNAAAAAAVTKK